LSSKKRVSLQLFLRNRNMVELVLKSEIKEEKMDALLHFLKVWDIDIEVKKTPDATRSGKGFPLSAGLWADYDIDDRMLRAKAWGTHVI
jgi:hypothetical protein